MMTISQVVKASKKHKYLGLRFRSGILIGVNSRVIKMALEKTNKHLNCNSDFSSYRSLNLNEYISIKITFC